MSCLLPGESATVVLNGGDYGLWYPAYEWEWEDGRALSVYTGTDFNEMFYAGNSPYEVTAKVSDGNDDACWPVTKPETSEKCRSQSRHS